MENFVVRIKKISRCRICNSKNLKRILKIKNMPFTDQFLLKKNLGDEFKEDIEIFMCNDCSVTQTLKDIQVDDYYNDYQYSVGKSSIANNFMKKLSNNINSSFFKSKKKKSVLEIGSGDGAQLKEFKKLGFKTTGYEPSHFLSKRANKNGIYTINEMFSKESIKKLQKDCEFDLVLLSYTFDHLQRPREFLKNIDKIITENGLLVIEIHDLDKIFTNLEFCLFEHEHSIYLNKRTAKYILNLFGFQIIDFNIVRQIERRANSLLFVAQKRKIKTKDKKTISFNEDLKSFFLFKKRMKKAIKNLDNFVKELRKSGKRIAGYGAGGRGVMTLAGMTQCKSLDFLIEKNPKSKNIFTPVSNIPVFNIPHLKENKVDNILVFSFGYMNEIKKDLNNLGYKNEQIISFVDVMKGKNG